MAYQVAESDANRQPGPQNPGKYPSVGPNYLYFGDQPGWLYDPWQDIYRKDPKAEAEYLESMGHGQPKEPSLFESVAPLAGAALALSGGTELGKQIPGLFGVGSGGAAPVVTPTVTPAASSSIAAGIGDIAPAAISQGGTPAAAAPVTGGGMLGANGALATYGVPAAVIGSTILGGKAALDMYNGKDANPLGRGILGIATGGLSELGKAAGLFGGKSTKDYQRERLESLKNESPTWYQHMQNVQASNDAATTPADGWAEGEKWTFAKANELNKQRGTDFVTSQGNAETIGDVFFTAPTEKQIEFSRRASEEGLYHSDKGSVLIKDSKQGRARDLWDEILNSPTSAAATRPSGLMGIGGSAAPQASSAGTTGSRLPASQPRVAVVQPSPAPAAPEKKPTGFLGLGGYKK